MEPVPKKRLRFRDRRQIWLVLFLTASFIAFLITSFLYGSSSGLMVLLVSSLIELPWTLYLSLTPDK